MNLYEALDKYNEIKQQQRLKPTSLQAIEYRVKRLKKHCPNIEIDTINTKMVQDWVIKWEEIFAAGTIPPMLVCLKECLLMHNIKIDRIKKYKKPENKLKIYSLNELHILDNYLKTHKLKDYCVAVAVARYTGLRVGEILGLRWKDIDFENCLLRVTNNVVVVGCKKIIQTPKTLTSAREVPIPQELMEILAERKIQDDYFVIGQKDYPSGSRGVQRGGQCLFEKIGIEWKGFHAFRHTYATTMLEKGVNAKVVADLLGHSKVDTTLNIYSHTTNELKTRIVNEVFNKKVQTTITEKENIYKQLKEMNNILNELFKKVANMEVVKTMGNI